jgi:hypothetical protein
MGGAEARGPGEEEGKSEVQVGAIGREWEGGLSRTLVCWPAACGNVGPLSSRLAGCSQLATACPSCSTPENMQGSRLRALGLGRLHVALHAARHGQETVPIIEELGELLRLRSQELVRDLLGRQHLQVLEESLGFDPVLGDGLGVILVLVVLERESEPPGLLPLLPELVAEALQALLRRLGSGALART